MELRAQANAVLDRTLTRLEHCQGPGQLSVSTDDGSAVGKDRSGHCSQPPKAFRSISDPFANCPKSSFIPRDVVINGGSQRLARIGGHGPRLVVSTSRGRSKRLPYSFVRFAVPRSSRAIRRGALALAVCHWFLGVVFESGIGLEKCRRERLNALELLPDMSAVAANCQMHAQSNGVE